MDLTKQAKRAAEQKLMKAYFRGRQPSISSDGKVATFTDGSQYTLTMNKNAKPKPSGFKKIRSKNV